MTYILALGAERIRGERPSIAVPVYLGDAVRSEQDDTLLSAGGITIYTTDGAELLS